METQGSRLCRARGALLLLLLLGLAVPAPPAAAQAARALSYPEAVRLAVQSFNQRSGEASLYRLLQAPPPPPRGDPNPDAPRPVSFTLQETVCPRRTRRPPEECDFKEKGLVKECSGSVILDPDNGYFDVTCEEIQNVNARRLGELIRRGGEKLGRKIEGIGRRIRDFFANLVPREGDTEPEEGS